ncbi:putative DNA-binding domain-containing protein [Tritonibacter sp. SIMBA_163]|uniref:HvfC/BufC family peptide modification chaperone n=1 Tax=Tritonibacter sp. SIMBA_163 TaxID=3080868 RepID=UPI00397FB0A1
MSREDQFTRAILDARLPVPEGLLDGADLPAGRRFSVYRNNVAVSLTEALHQGFPVITKLLGPENMDGLAALYLRAQPPTSPLMMHYGQGFPDFLEGLEQLSHLGYLGDVARLELALRRSYHAADAPPLDTLHLGTLPPDELMASRLSFAPAMAVLRSPWPIHAIWAYNTHPDAPKPIARAEDVLITRPEFDPIPQPLPPGGADWIARLQAGETLGSATEAVTSDFPDFDLSAPLALLIEGLALTDLSQ